MLFDSIVVFAKLAAIVDALHAVAMVGWVLGLPLLFWHRWPRITRVYAVYAVVFAVLSEASQAIGGECFLTSISRWLWSQQTTETRTLPDEWFTVRLAKAVFGFIPSHHAIADASKALVVFTAAGVLFTMDRHRRTAKRTAQ